MNIKKHIYIILGIIVFNFFCFDKCFSNEFINQPLLETLTKVEHSSWREKDIVIRKIQSSQIKVLESEKSQLMEMFEKESKFQDEYVTNLRSQGYSVNEAMDKFTQEIGWGKYLGYFGNFATLISSFKDVRAIPSLLRGLQQYGGAVVPTHIIALGEEAVKPLMDLIDSKDRTLSTMSFAVLATWVNAPIASEDYAITKEMAMKNPTVLERIKTIFLNALHDKNIDVRSSAVYGLKAFPEDMVLRELEEVAKNDPYSFYSTYEKKMTYPIREDATKSIKKIKEKMKIKIPQEN